MDIEWEKIKRVITGKASEQEKQEVETWKKEREQREEFYEDAVSYYGRIPEENDDLSQEEIARAWQRVRERAPKRRRVSRQIIGWVAGAAILPDYFGEYGYFSPNPCVMCRERLRLKGFGLCCRMELFIRYGLRNRLLWIFPALR